MDVWIEDGWMDGRMDGGVDGWMDGWMDRSMDIKYVRFGLPGWCIIVVLKVALKSGSSKHGNTRRASVDWSWEAASAL